MGGTSRDGKFRGTRRQYLTAVGGIGALGAGLGLVQGSGPIEIQDWHDLDSIRQGLDKDYRLVADLDSTSSGYNKHVADPEGGWVPIGEGELNEEVGLEAVFTGTLNGDGHVIRDLKLNRPSEDLVGLFLWNRGEIRELSLLDCSINGAEGVGALVGGNDGELSRISSVGTVSGTDIVGGLCGANGKAVIRESMAGGSVAGERIVGGLVGINNHEVANAYTSATVEGESDVGGIAGVGDEDSETAQSYAVGEVTGQERTGGVIGAVFSNENISDLYWNLDTSGQENGIGEGGSSVGLTTAEMQGESATESMPALDFENIWSTTDGYPILSWQDGLDRNHLEEEMGPAASAEESTEDDGEADSLNLGVATAIGSLATVGYLVQRTQTSSE